MVSALSSCKAYRVRKEGRCDRNSECQDVEDEPDCCDGAVSPVFAFSLTGGPACPHGGLPLRTPVACVRSYDGELAHIVLIQFLGMRASSDEVIKAALRREG